MSNEEEDAIIGRMTKERVAARRRQIVLQEEIERIGGTLTTLGRTLSRRSARPELLTEEQQAALSLDKLQELISEANENNTRIKELDEKMRELGL